MSETDLKVIVKSKELATHSFKITSNCNRYPKKYRHSLVDKIQIKSLEIYENLFEANRINNKTDKRARCETITEAITYCDELMFFIELSMNLGILNGGSAEYWTKLASDEDICWLCDLFIDSTEGKGIPLGNQINQGFALLYLDGMDKLITGELGIEYYGRYMDDFYLIHQDKRYLKCCLDVITEFLKTLELTLNGKTQIFPFKNGVSYLGFHTYITESNKIIRKLKNQNKRNAQRKFIRMAKLVVTGKLSAEKFNASYGAWKNHISHGNCYKLGKTMDEKINKILKGGRQA